MGLNQAIRGRRPPVRGILLDVYDTLFPIGGLCELFTRRGIDPALASCWHARTMRDGLALTAAGDFRRFGDIAKSNFLALDPRRLGQAEAASLLACLQTLDPYPDVVRGLQLIRDAGARVMTLTAGEAALCEALFVHAGLRPMVDGFLSADTVRRWPPAPELYAYGVTQLGWPAANVALIAAQDWNVHGARRAGLQTGFIARGFGEPSPLFAAPDAAGDDLPAVVHELLEGK